MIKVLLVGRQALPLAGLRALISRAPRFEVVGQRTRMWDTFPLDRTSAPPAPTPDVAVVDYDSGDAFEPLVEMGASADLRPPFLVLTDSDDADLLGRMFRLGARGLIFKDQSPQVLIDAIQRVHEGEMWLDRSMTTRLITGLLHSGDNPILSQAPHLSPRDHRIIELVGEGLSNGEVASALCVSEATVRNRLTTIFKEVGVTGRLQLMVYACQHGLGPPVRLAARSQRSTTNRWPV